MGQAAVLVGLATAVFLLLRTKYRTAPWWKPGVTALLVCWTAVILLGTLGQRAGGENLAAPILTPFYSYWAARYGGRTELYRTNFMNTILFYPAGLLGCGLLPQRWGRFPKAALAFAVFALMSIGIEYTQFRLGLGLAETDDVIHNALGGLLGALACDIPFRRRT